MNNNNLVPHSQQDTRDVRPSLEEINRRLAIKRLEQKIDLLMFRDLKPILERNNPLQREEEVPEEEFWGLMEVAEYFKVSTKTIYNWIYLGRIPYYKATGRLLFKKSEMVSLLNKKYMK